jgi:hypothetical protein
LLGQRNLHRDDVNFGIVWMRRCERRFYPGSGGYE